MTENLWRDTQLADHERTDDGEAETAAPWRSAASGKQSGEQVGRTAHGPYRDPWLACDAGMHDSTASRLLLTATRCLIVAQLDPRAVEDDVAALLGASHRRVTILLRTLLCEMALHARKRVGIGSSCRPRPTEDEARLLEIIAAASTDDTETAHAHAVVLLGGGATDRVVPLAAALGEAMRDAGLPMRRAGPARSWRTLH